MANSTMKDVKVALSKVRSLLIVLPELVTLDTAVAAKLLTTLLTKSLNKPTKLLLPSTFRLSTRVADFLGSTEFPKEGVVNSVLPLKYNLTLPNVEEGTEVEWKLENSALEIVLKPRSGKIDFSKLAFGAEGERYEAIVTLGAQNKLMLNEAFQSAKDTVAQSTIINLDCHPRNEQFGKLNVIDEKASTVTELVFTLYKELGVKLDKADADLAKKTIVVSTDGLRRIASSATLTSLVDLEKIAENNVSEVVRTHYHSLGKKGLDLREAMLKNATLEKESQLLWSYVSAEELKKMEIEPAVLDGIEQLPYNICKDVRIAVLLYQDKDTWQAVAISNDRRLSLFNWAKALGGKGTASVAAAQIKGGFETASQTMLMSIKKESLGEIIEIKKAEIKKMPESVAKSPFQDASEQELKETVSGSSQDKAQAAASILGSPKSPFEKADQFK